MDKHFMAIAILGVIVLGALGLVAGVALIIVTKEAGTGAACIGLASAALGALAGILAAPKVVPATSTGIPTDLSAFQTAVKSAADTLKQ
jgi:hypothetical protein